MKKKSIKSLAFFMGIVMLFSIVPAFASNTVSAQDEAPTPVIVDWEREFQEMDGFGTSFAFNKGEVFLHLAEMGAPEVGAHLMELVFCRQNGMGQRIVRPIMGDGGVMGNGTFARPGFNPINGERADPENPGFDVTGVAIPMASRAYATTTAATGLLGIAHTSALASRQDDGTARPVIRIVQDGEFVLPAPTAANYNICMIENGNILLPWNDPRLPEPGSPGSLRDEPYRHGFAYNILGGNETPLLGAFGYTLGDWGTRYHDGSSDTIAPNEISFTYVDGERVYWRYVWEDPNFRAPNTDIGPGATNRWTGNVGEVEHLTTDRSMAQLFDRGQVWVMNQAFYHGVRTFYINAWTPPYWMKSNMSIHGTNPGPGLPPHLRVDRCPEDGHLIYFRAFAEYMAANVFFYWTEFGIPMTHVAPLNEAENIHGYSSHQIRCGRELHDLMDEIYRAWAIYFGEDGEFTGAQGAHGRGPLNWVPAVVIGEATNMVNAFNPNRGGTPNYTGAWFANPDNHEFGHRGLNGESDLFRVYASTHMYGTLTPHTAAQGGRIHGGAVASPAVNPMVAGPHNQAAFPNYIRNFRLWQGEFMTNDGGNQQAFGVTQRHYYHSIADGLRWFNTITNAFNSDPGFNAWIWWWTVATNGANGSDLIRFQTTGTPQNAWGCTVNTSYHIFQRFWTTGHLSRFIEPGSIRIYTNADAHRNAPNWMNSIATRTADSCDFAVSIANLDWYPRLVEVELRNFDGFEGDLTDGLTLFRTSSSEAHRRIEGIEVVSRDGSYFATVTLPPQSLITLVPADGEMSDFSCFAHMRTLYTTLEAGEDGVDAVIGNPTHNELDAHGFSSTTMRHGDAIVFHNLDFADGSASGAISARRNTWLMANIENAPAGGILRMYVAPVGTEITDPSTEGTYIGYFLIPQGTEAPRLLGTQNYFMNGLRSTRLDTSYDGAFKYMDLYLVAYGPADADLFTVSRLRFDAHDGGIWSGVVPAAQNDQWAIPLHGFFINGDFENGTTAGSTDGWSPFGGGTLTSTNVENFNGLNVNRSFNGAFSGQLSDREYGAGIQRDITALLVPGEIYTFRGQFMTSATRGTPVTGTASLAFLDEGGNEIDTLYIGSRALSRHTYRQSGRVPRIPVPGQAELHSVFTGMPMNMISINATWLAPRSWNQVAGTFEFAPPAGTVTTVLRVSGSDNSDMFFDALTLRSTPNRDMLLEIINAADPCVDLQALIPLAQTVFLNPDATQAEINAILAAAGAILSRVEFTGANPVVLAGLLENNDVILKTPGNLGIFEHHSPFVIPEGATLYVQTALNVSRGAELVVEGRLVVLEGGRLNNQGDGNATGLPSRITVAPGGTLVNRGHVENVSGSIISNCGAIINTATINVRARTQFSLVDCGTFEGTFTSHADAILNTDLCVCD